MSDSVLLFTADDIRGKIINKVLNRNGLECQIFSQVLDAGGQIAKHAPKVVIVDTENCFSEEINRLRNMCRQLRHTVAIVLGEASVVERFDGPLMPKTLCLADPFDPELIAAKIKEITSQKKRRTGGDSLENTLKKFLNLD